MPDGRRTRPRTGQQAIPGATCRARRPRGQPEARDNQVQQEPGSDATTEQTGGHRAERADDARLGGSGAGRRPDPHRPFRRVYLHLRLRRALAGKPLSAVAGAGERRWRAGPAGGREAPRRIRQLRRPVEPRQHRAHLRAPDRPGQDGPAGGALGHAHAPRAGAGAATLQVPDGRQHRRLGAAAQGGAGPCVVRYLGHPRQHGHRDGGDAPGQRHDVGRRACQRTALCAGVPQLPAARAEGGGYRSAGGPELSARCQGHDRDAARGEGQGARCRAG